MCSLNFRYYIGNYSLAARLVLPRMLRIYRLGATSDSSFDSGPALFEESVGRSLPSSNFSLRVEPDGFPERVRQLQDRSDEIGTQRLAINIADMVEQSPRRGLIVWLELTKPSRYRF
jgi:hypothetical protein